MTKREVRLRVRLLLRKQKPAGKFKLPPSPAISLGIQDTVGIAQSQKPVRILRQTSDRVLKHHREKGHMIYWRVCSVGDISARHYDDTLEETDISLEALGEIWRHQLLKVKILLSSYERARDFANDRREESTFDD